MAFCHSICSFRSQVLYIHTKHKSTLYIAGKMVFKNQRKTRHHHSTFHSDVETNFAIDVFRVVIIISNHNLEEMKCSTKSLYIYDIYPLYTYLSMLDHLWIRWKNQSQDIFIVDSIFDFHFRYFSKCTKKKSVKSVIWIENIRPYYSLARETPIDTLVNNMAVNQIHFWFDLI